MMDTSLLDLLRQGNLGGLFGNGGRATIPRFVNNGGMSGEWVPHRPGIGTGGVAVPVPQASSGYSVVSKGLPNGLGSQSAGLFDQYMQDIMSNRGPTITAPTFAPLGAGAPSGSGAGGSGSGLFGGSDGNGVGTGIGSSAGGTGSGFSGFGAFGGPGGRVSIGGGVLGAMRSMMTPDIQAALAAYSAATGRATSAELAAQAAAQLDTNPDVNGLVGDIGYGYGGEGIGGGGGYGDGAAGPGGNGSSGSDANGGADGPGGSTGGAGGGWAKGGFVKKSGLMGMNPPGPDDGYGALDAGELVVPKKVAKKLNKRQVAGLLGR